MTGITKHPSTTTNEGKIQYGGIFYNIKAHSFDQVTLTFDHQIPYMILTEAQRTIGVSHWGNIQVDEHFRVENIGPKVKGQYSRFDIDMNQGGQGCLRKLHSEYPYYIKGLYMGDFIGNISTSHAFRDTNNVRVELKTRYPVCGGWQNDWNQGYSMPTRFHL